MLNTVEVRTIQGTLLTLPLEDISNGIVLEEVTGLHPVKATLVSSSVAGRDGEQYQSSRRESRNIGMKLGLEPDYSIETVSDVRNRLYDYFMPESEIMLRFSMDSGLEVDIPGVVESCEADQFVEEPVMDVSIMCFDPDFFDREPVEFSGMTTATEGELLLRYDGTIETGTVFVLNLDRDISEFSIYHRPPDGTLRILEFVNPLSAGDVLTISSIPGAKGATVTQSGQDGSVLWGISPQSSWLELKKGDNYIRVYTEGAPIPFTITYTNKYGGL